MSQIAMIGGVFIKAEDPVALAHWYAEHFELEFQDWGNCRGLTFSYKDDHGEQKPQVLVFSFHKAKGPLAPDRGQCVINYRVHSMKNMLAHLESKGITITEKEESDFGKFAWINDPEGNRIELWEAPAQAPDAT